MPSGAADATASGTDSSKVDQRRLGQSARAELFRQRFTLTTTSHSIINFATVRSLLI